MNDASKNDPIPGVPRHAGKGMRIAPALALAVLAERWGGSMVPVEDEAEGKIGWLKERMAWIDSQLAAQGAEAQP